MLVAYRLAVLRAAEDVENAFSALVKREDLVGILAQGVDPVGRARVASFAAYQKGGVSLIEVRQADESLRRAANMRAQAQTVQLFEQTARRTRLIMADITSSRRSTNPKSA